MLFLKIIITALLLLCALIYFKMFSLEEMIWEETQKDANIMKKIKKISDEGKIAGCPQEIFDTIYKLTRKAFGIIVAFLIVTLFVIVIVL